MADSLVLGAGIVGVSVAIHLAKRGRSVVLVDRREAGEETSYGNAGLIQREGVAPYAFPQQLGEILRYGRNDRIDMHYHPAALPAIAPFLARYWWNSRPESYARVVRQYAPLIAACIAEHAPLIAEAGADAADVAKLTIYLDASVDPDEAYRASAEVWGMRPTAVTVLKVAALGRPGALVGIEAIAALD